MPDVYTVTPQPVAGQQGSPLIRWLDRYAQAHAAAVAQMTVGDFSPWVVAQIDEAVDGDTVTTTNFAMVVTPRRAWASRAAYAACRLPWRMPSR